MKLYTRIALKQLCLAGLLSLGLLASGCGNSDAPSEDTEAPVQDPVNQPPIAADDVFSVDNGSTTTLDLTANDSDADDGLDLASITILTTPASGSVVVNTDGSVTYTHACSDSATDEFTYSLKDNATAESNTAKVTLTLLSATPGVEVGVYESTVVEAADDLEFVVSLSSVSDRVISLNYATADRTAVAGIDYSSVNGALQFSCGELRKFVSVPVLDNPIAAAASSKNMRLVLSDLRNAGLQADASIGKGTIIDKDVMPTVDAFDQHWSSTGVFSGAAVCANCHQSDGVVMQYDDPDVNLSTDDISPSTQWPHSVMANSFNDPYWQAAVEDEAESFPLLSGLIEDTCTTCHAPMGHTQAHQTSTDLDADGFFRFDTAKAQDHSREGISCTLCHQIQESDADSGKFIISDDVSNKVIFGPYENPRINPMLMSTGYSPDYRMHMEKSSLCGNCHTLYTPALDPDTGLPSGPGTNLPSADKGFLEQGTYLEWQNSSFATRGVDCQDCHMPVPSDSYRTRISTRPPMLSEREPYAQHSLVGGNAHLLEILSNYRAELGIAGSTSTQGFADQIELTRAFLGGAAAIAIGAPSAAGDGFKFDIEITNLAGHKIPSGYPSRRTWLHVTVKDNAGNVIFESGKPDSRGYISTDESRLKADCLSKTKLEGFDSSLCYEPHRDFIDDSSQVAIYETVMGDINGNITHTLLQAAQYLKDNRIPPSGFTNGDAATIEEQTIPAGVTGDVDFNCVDAAEGCGADTIHYQVVAEDRGAPYSIEARLLYQATQPGFVDGMHTVGERVNRFKVMYDAVPPGVEVLASAYETW